SVRLPEGFTLDQAMPWFLGLWLAGVCGLTTRALGGWSILILRSRRGRREAAASVRSRAERLAAALGVSRVRVFESLASAVPATCGWLRPVILLPASSITGLPPEQLEAVLTHELAHIARHDYLVNLLQVAVETLLFFHPAVWWISGHIRHEREVCCDELALTVYQDRLQYSRALLAVEEQRSLFAMAASGGDLRTRIERILSTQPAGKASPDLTPFLAIAALVGLAVFPTLSQETRPAPPSPPPASPAALVQPVAPKAPIAPAPAPIAPIAPIPPREPAEPLFEPDGAARLLQRFERELRLRERDWDRLRPSEIKLRQLEKLLESQRETIDRFSRQLDSTGAALEKQVRDAKRALESRDSRMDQTQFLFDKVQKVERLLRSQKEALEKFTLDGGESLGKKLRSLEGQLQTRDFLFDQYASQLNNDLARRTRDLARFNARLALLQSGSGRKDSPADAFTKWLNEDVVYIISGEERQAFLRLKTGEEREKFIRQFWQRRDPTPGTPVNEAQEEHYRRIAYAIERYADGVPGWQTDRGKVYITFGPPDEIESHPVEGREDWRYRKLKGYTGNVDLRFTQGKLQGDLPKPNGK
ncbi:MAG: GWxTD domain-containing protein, partial [Bryobacteraceae bacterium]